MGRDAVTNVLVGIPKENLPLALIKEKRPEKRRRDSNGCDEESEPTISKEKSWAASGVIFRGRGEGNAQSAGDIVGRAKGDHRNSNLDTVAKKREL